MSIRAVLVVIILNEKGWFTLILRFKSPPSVSQIPEDLGESFLESVIMNFPSANVISSIPSANYLEQTAWRKCKFSQVLSRANI